MEGRKTPALPPEPIEQAVVKILPRAIRASVPAPTLGAPGAWIASCEHGFPQQLDAPALEAVMDRMEGAYVQPAVRGQHHGQDEIRQQLQGIGELEVNAGPGGNRTGCDGVQLPRATEPLRREAGSAGEHGAPWYSGRSAVRMAPMPADRRARSSMAPVESLHRDAA
jgi:hypothetical protein